MCERRPASVETGGLACSCRGLLIQRRVLGELRLTCSRPELAGIKSLDPRLGLRGRERALARLSVTPSARGNDKDESHKEPSGEHEDRLLALCSLGRSAAYRLTVAKGHPPLDAPGAWQRR
jgi:hypothetical protein